MLVHKPFSEIGGDDIGWLKAKHHFAIGPYGNPRHLPLGNLYVLNDDEIAPYSGFPFHGHRDVEIVTYVRQGTLTHEDTLGNKGHLRAGDVQVMSAGTGIRHSEYNEDDTPILLVQIWLHPRERGGTPRWEMREFPRKNRTGGFVPLVSGYAVPGTLTIRSDAELHCAILRAEEVADFDFRPGHSGYLLPVIGTVAVNGQNVGPREGLSVSGESSFRLQAVTDTEVILIGTAGIVRC